MSFQDEIDQLDDSCFELFGVAGTYTPAVGDPVAVTVIINRDVELVGSDAVVVERRHVLAFRKREVSIPKRAETCVVDAETFKMDRVVDDDGHVVQVAVI